MGGVQPIVPRGQPHLPTRNRMIAKLQDRVPVIRPDALQEAGGWMEEYF